MPKLTKTPEQIKEDYLRTIKVGLVDIGVPNPNVSEGSDYYVQATAISEQISAVFNNLEFTADQQMPDTAVEADLDRILSIYGLERRPAGGAAGQITIECSAPTLVATGTQLQSSLGVVYQVTVGGTFSDGDTIDVSSVDVGAKTNLAAGALLTWVGAPAFTKATAEVTRAITGGVDEEDDETARARLLSRLANPPGAGNWQQVAELAEATDPVVQKAFVYPAANGPSTLMVAVVGYPSEASKSRVVDSTKLNSIIIPTILGNLPEYVETTITTVEDVPVDVAINLTLPLATSSSSTISGPGIGGGWIDPTPWPTVNLSSHYFIPVTTVTDSTHFRVSVPTGLAPTNGVSKVNWIDKTSWKVKQATVQTGTLISPGIYELAIDTPFVGIAANDWIFPASVNAQTYLDSLLEAFKLMGPGEKTDLVALLPRASRKPRPSSSYPMSVDSSLLRYVINAGDEVLTASYHYRGTSTPATQVTSSTITPALPGSITAAPKILIPRQIGFYPPYPLA